MKSLLFLFYCCTLLITSCNSKHPESEKYKPADYGGSDDFATYPYIFEDGRYCAEVKYYNPHSGKKSTYTLPIEVEDNKLVKIEFTNGGWLDDSHFTPPSPNDDEFFKFTDDRGYEYEVAILKDEDECKTF